MGLELQIIKKSSKKPKMGDIFRLTVREDLHCFGRVILTDIQSRDSFVNGMNMIFIYDYFSDKMCAPDNLEKKELLLVEIVNNQLWKKGYAFNVGFSSVTNDDLNMDYAFWDMLKKEWVDVEGKTVDREPKYSGIYGLGSYGIVAKDISRIIKERRL
jgi:hypothetical protein